FSLIRRLPCSILFPYTTLFRSSLQYVLMLNVFGEDFHWNYFLYVSIIYFWSTLIPSFIWGKLFIRETVALVILSAVIPNTNIIRSEEHTSELQSRENLVCRLLL